MKLTVYPDSTNYTCQVVKLPAKQALKGLDNLVGVNVQGNLCLIGKDSPETTLYLFFPAGCQIDSTFLSMNNLYRNPELNLDKDQKGFFEENGRVKTIKFKGNISSGFIIPIDALPREFYISAKGGSMLKVGDEFNEIDSCPICKKYVIKVKERGPNYGKSVRIIDQIIDSRFAPEHFDTQHLMKNLHKIGLEDNIIVTYKLHGTSARYFNAPTNRKLNWVEKLLQRIGTRIQTTEHQYISASRKCVKSVGFEQLPNKNHFYSEDLWSKVGKEQLEGKLNQGEAVYCEIVGTTFSGEAIQKNYSYGFKQPEVFVYRISNITAQGIEIDLPYEQMCERATQLCLKTCPEFYRGTLHNFLIEYGKLGGSIKDDRDKEYIIDKLFYETLLEKPSIIDPTVAEEGFCIRIDRYPKPEIFKIKSKLFLLHEGALMDEEVQNIEDDESQTS